MGTIDFAERLYATSPNETKAMHTEEEGDPRILHENGLV